MQSETRIWQRLCALAGISEGGTLSSIISHKTAVDKAHIIIRLDPVIGQPLVYKRVLSKLDEQRFLGLVAGAQLAADLLVNDPRHRAPQVIAHMVEARAMLMEFASGQTLAARLNASSDVTQEMKRAGAWLSAFHRASAAGPQPFRPQHLINAVSRVLSEVRNDLRQIAYRDEFLAAASKLQKSFKSFRGDLTPVAVRHGDPSVNNLLVSVDVVWGIDMMGPVKMAVAMDIARLTQSMAETAGLGGMSRYTRTLQTLLAGYDAPVPEPELISVLARHRAIMLWARTPDDWRALSPTEAQRLERRIQLATHGIT